MSDYTKEELLVAFQKMNKEAKRLASIAFDLCDRLEEYEEITGKVLKICDVPEFYERADSQRIRMDIILNQIYPKGKPGIIQAAQNISEIED